MNERFSKILGIILMGAVLVMLYAIGMLVFFKGIGTFYNLTPVQEPSQTDNMFAYLIVGVGICTILFAIFALDRGKKEENCNEEV